MKYIPIIKDFSGNVNKKVLLSGKKYIVNYYNFFSPFLKICPIMKIETFLDVSYVHNCFNVCYNWLISYNFDYNECIETNS